jgi:hypothetical protein
MFLSIGHATGTPLGESDALGRPTEPEGAATAGHVGPMTYPPPPLKRLGLGWTERLQSVAQAGVDGVAALRLVTRLGWRGRGSGDRGSVALGRLRFGSSGVAGPCGAVVHGQEL